MLPARMHRLLVGGHQDNLASVIEVLHAEGVVHIEDYADPAGLTKIGSPLPEGSKIAELLLRTRGLQKALGAEGMSAQVPTNEHPERLLEDAETETGPLMADVQRSRADAAQFQGERDLLAGFTAVDVDLGLLGTLRSVKGFLGTARSEPAGLRALGDVSTGPAAGGIAMAAFVPVGKAAQAEKLLSEVGFSPAHLPAGITGTPAARVAALDAKLRTAQATIASADAKLAAARAAWGPRLGALERYLVGEAEKTQAPLRFGVTASTFHIEGWVPAGQVAALESTLKAKFGSKLYTHDLGDAPAAHRHGADDHGHGAGHAHGDGHGHDDGHADEHHDDPNTEPPVKLVNPAPAKPYEWILGLLAQPRYKEVDPSRLMLIFFPLFFGLMVGDIVTGILITAFGIWLKKNRFIGIGGPAVGKAIMAGGIMAIVMGGFLFGEAMGIHFVVSPEGEAEGEMSWEQILHLDIPFESDADHGLLYKTGSSGEAGALVDEHGQPLLDEHGNPLAEGAAHHGGILSPHSETHLTLGGVVFFGYYSKLHDVQPMMVIALIIAAVHIILGLAIGFRNVKAAHGLPLAVQEKGAFITLLAGLAIAVVGAGSPALLYGGIAVIVVSIALLWMGAAKVYGAGYVAILELPGLAGNFVSYTRLAAIGAAEGGLGLAVLTICFKTLPGGAIGWILYTVGFVALTLLSILSGGLQSLRLQFVEFFGKFYQGGGRPYVPFGRRAA